MGVSIRAWAGHLPPPPALSCPPANPRLSCAGSLPAVAVGVRPGDEPRRLRVRVRPLSACLSPFPLGERQRSQPLEESRMHYTYGEKVLDKLQRPASVEHRGKNKKQTHTQKTIGPLVAHVVSY